MEKTHHKNNEWPAQVPRSQVTDIEVDVGVEDVVVAQLLGVDGENLAAALDVRQIWRTAKVVSYAGNDSSTKMRQNPAYEFQA